MKPTCKEKRNRYVIDTKTNTFQMIKDLIICTLSSFNILMFSFIGFNYEAFKKLNNYQASAKEFQNFDHIAWRIIHDFSANKPIVHESAPNTPSDPSILISIPKLNLLAPIKQTTTPENITQALEQGVLSLHTFDATEPSGQTILFGHSSDYPWKKNPFGTIFTLLPQLQSGDEILITKNQQITRYKVKNTLITDAQLSGLLQDTPEHELILSTCYPIGFFNKRFNVIAVPTENEKRKT